MTYFALFRATTTKMLSVLHDDSDMREPPAATSVKQT